MILVIVTMLVRIWMTFDKLLVNMVESGEIVLTKSIRKNIQSESAVYVKVKVRDCDSRFQKKTDMFG